MSCATPECAGELDSREITHAVSHGTVRIVVERLPAEICPDCGHTLISAETHAHLDRLLRSRRRAPRRPLRYSE
jgi:YgiT-type zinc finger domain-containing protein